MRFNNCVVAAHIAEFLMIGGRRSMDSDRRLPPPWHAEREVDLLPAPVPLPRPLD